jgi:hypothetical protein
MNSRVQSEKMQLELKNEQLLFMKRLLLASACFRFYFVIIRLKPTKGLPKIHSPLVPRTQKKACT